MNSVSGGILEKLAQLKNAELQTDLLPHQERLKNRLQNQRGLVAAWSMGRGKSLGSIAAMDSIGKPATVITPASLKGNFNKEVSKHVKGPIDYHQDSIENLARKQTTKANPLLIVDEAHNLRNPASKSLQAVKNLNKNVEKTLLLTGTPMVNRPSDMSPLINLAAGDKVLPEDANEFEKKYVYEKQVKPGLWNSLKGIKPGIVPVINRKEINNLRDIYQKWVDYEPASKEGFPDVEEQEVRVPMTDKQTAIYDSLLGTAPAWVAAKIKAGLPPDKKESKDLNAYAQAIRQAANTTAPFITKGEADSPKIQRAFSELQNMLKNNPQGRGVVYSNYLKAGIEPYKKLLQDNNIPFGEFTGGIDQATRDQTVKDYNEGKLRALLLSGAGGTGLDLKGTNLMQLLESGWNDPVLDQAKARAIRYKSHEGLPPEQQKVIVQKFLSTRPEGLLQKLKLSKQPGMAIDEYLQNLARDKTNLNNQFRDLMLSPEQLQEKTANIEDDVSKFIDTKDYSLLFNKLKSTKFTNEIMKKIDDKEFHNFVLNNRDHLRAKNKGLGETVQSKSRPGMNYTVVQHNNKWTCDCPSYKYVKAPKNEECKHIIEKKGTSKTAEINIPFYYQNKKFACGPSSMRMVLSHFGVDKTEDECIELIGAREGRGCETDQIVSAFKKLGFKCYEKSLTMKEAKDLLDKQIPIIADIRSYTGNHGHYVVLRDISDTHVMINDPNTKGNIRKEKIEDFEKRWWDYKMDEPRKGEKMIRWGIVIERR